ncbi:MAG: methionyl-tRNA formyltransferase, partial [Rhodospirillaceae bacterium]|nr:methionyl-tRNA formyltransferase [Rhodospirillaceae bacterium]
MTGAVPLRLAFMGTPAFAVPSLEALLDAGHDVVAVYTQPPRPAGRGKRPMPSPVHEVALVRGLVVRTPRSLRKPAEAAAFAALRLDAAVVVAYGLILPKAILEAPRLGCINLHASLLPRWRGAAPIQRAILAGDAETGVSVMLMDEGLDTGPVLATDRTAIGPQTTAAELQEELATRGARLLVATLAAYADGEVKPVPQPSTGATYAPKLTREEGRIDWSQPASALDRQIRAFAPWPGAWFERAGERIKVLAAVPVAEAGGG